MIGNGYDRETGLSYWDYNATSELYDTGDSINPNLTGYKAMPDPAGPAGRGVATLCLHRRVYGLRRVRA